MTIKKISEIIRNRINEQKKLLTGDLEEDKAVAWRIIGFEDLEKEIINMEATPS